jgi:transcriptional regulator with XRE-family HTH domain
MARVNVENARALYPSCDMGVAEWAAFFATPGGESAFAKIIYDIIDEVKSQEEKAGGLKRIGRRPARAAMRYQEVMDLVFPAEFDNEPFREVLKREMRARGMTQGQFAYKIPVDRAHLSRILSGDKSLNIDFIERASKVLGWKPWRFPEWRAMYFGQLIEEVLLEAPHLGTVLLKNTRRARARYEGAEL